MYLFELIAEGKSLAGKRGACGKLCATCPKRHTCKNIPEGVELSEKSPEAKANKEFRRKEELYPNILKPEVKKDWHSAAHVVSKKTHPGFFRWITHQITGNMSMGEGVIAERRGASKADKTVVSRHPQNISQQSHATAPEARAEDIFGATSLLAYASH